MHSQELILKVTHFYLYSQNLHTAGAGNKGGFPDYVVVLAVRPSSSVDFCVLVFDPLQVRLLTTSRGFEGVAPLEREREREREKGGGRRLGGEKSERGAATPSPAAGVRLELNADLLAAVRSFRRRLAGLLFPPFHNSPPSLPCASKTNHRPTAAGSPQEMISRGFALKNSLIPPGEAESLVPTVPHVVEHRPRGPFQDQYTVAMYMLQKLMAGWGGPTKIEEFERVDFRVLCSREETFVRQTVAEVADSSLLSYLKLCPVAATMAAANSALEAVERRVICCGPGGGADRKRFSAFLDEVEASSKTLFVVVVECAHLTSSVARRSTKEQFSSSLEDAAFSDNEKLLSSLPNCVLIYVSSHPFTLQTNRSLVSQSNEIHWPHPQKKGVESGETQFCSASDYQAAASPWQLGVAFREDRCFEELFQTVSTSLR